MLCVSIYIMFSEWHSYGDGEQMSDGQGTGMGWGDGYDHKKCNIRETFVVLEWFCTVISLHESVYTCAKMA